MNKFFNLILLTSLVVSSASSSAKQGPAFRFSDKIIREMVLTPDGKNVNFDGLQEILKRLIELDQQGLNRKGHSTKRASNPLENSDTPTPGLDSYLTVGKRPSTSDSLKLSVECDICASLVNIVGPILNIDAIWSTVFKGAEDYCYLIMGKTAANVCGGYVSKFEPVLHYIWPTAMKAPYTVCNSFFKGLGCGSPDNQYSLWEIPIPTPLPNLPPRAIGETPSKDKMTVLYMTDVHLDPEYQEGTTAECGDPLCCQASSAFVNGSRKAGKWGDYGLCDLPVRTLEDMLRYINETQADQIDFIMMGGDIVAHDAWQHTPEKIRSVMELFANKFSQWLPGKPFFFTLGNHESIPINSYSLPDDPPKYSSQWLYDKAAEVWMKWLDPGETNLTIRKAGFYTTLVRKGLRLIQLNTNFCHTDNWFLLGPSNNTDPCGQIQWLADTLAKAEGNRERVIILSHNQPGDGGCTQVWSWNYYRLVDRFQQIIAAQIHGHSHSTYFVMYYDAQTLTKPIGVGFIGPTGTTYEGRNIGYRLYDFDALNYTLLDYRQYYGDIGAANANASSEHVDWKLQYSAKHEFSLEDMSAASWSNFGERLQKNGTLFDIYYKHRLLNYVNAYPCYADCRHELLCEMHRSLASVDWCERFVPEYEPRLDDPNTQKCSERFDRE